MNGRVGQKTTEEAREEREVKGKGKSQVEVVERKRKKRGYVSTSLPTITICNDVIGFRLLFLFHKQDQNM